MTKRYWDVSFTLALEDTSSTGLDNGYVEEILHQRLSAFTESLKEHFKHGQRIPSKTPFKKDSPGKYRVIVSIEDEKIVFVKVDKEEE